METENNVEVQQNTKKKRIKLIAIIGGGCAIAIILFCSLFFTLFPFNEVKKDGFVFRKIESNGETGYTVSEYTEYETEIKIPSEIRGLPVIEIENVFSHCAILIEKIELPDTIRSIGLYAFSECKNLKEINMPTELKFIGVGAFAGCVSLEEINLPSGVLSIDGYTGGYGQGAFSNCNSLKQIIIPASLVSLGGKTFDGWDSTQKIYFETPRETAHWANVSANNENSWKYNCFAEIEYGYNNVTDNQEFDYVIHDNGVTITRYKSKNSSVIIPTKIDGYTVVGVGSTFIENDNIKTVSIEANLSSIPLDTFYECSNLETVILPTSITSIGGSAFNSCINLININIPKSVVSISSDAFAHCLSLREIYIPKEVIYMGSAVFRYCSEDLIIYIEAKTPPKGWCLEETGWVDWNPDGCYEIWGYKGD